MGYADNIFTAVIDQDGTIYEAGTGRKRQAVGVDSQREQELVQQITDMQETLDNYYAKLVELGVIVPPKTPEQLAQEQVRIMKDQSDQMREQFEQMISLNQRYLDQVTELKKEVGELKHGNLRSSDEPCIKPVGQDREGNWERPTGNQGRNKSSAKNAS